MATSSLAERRAERFSSRHKAFLLTAIARMRRDGLTAVNLTDLAADSGYSKGTWYNHFRSAEALLVEVAVVNTDLQFAYLTDIETAEALSPADRLASAFLSTVVQASTHPEIWTLAVNARIWDKKGDAGVAEAVSRLADGEQRNYEVLTRFADAALAVPASAAEDVAAGLDLVRAAADGLGVLATAKTEHRWSQEVSTRMTGALVRGALEAGGFQAPATAEMDRLCTMSWERVARLSDAWLLERA